MGGEQERLRTSRVAEPEPLWAPVCRPEPVHPFDRLQDRFGLRASTALMSRPDPTYGASTRLAPDLATLARALETNVQLLESFVLSEAGRLAVLDDTSALLKEIDAAGPGQLVQNQREVVERARHLTGTHGIAPLVAELEDRVLLLDALILNEGGHRAALTEVQFLLAAIDSASPAAPLGPAELETVQHARELLAADYAMWLSAKLDATMQRLQSFVLSDEAIDAEATNLRGLLAELEVVSAMVPPGPDFEQRPRWAWPKGSYAPGRVERARAMLAELDLAELGAVMRRLESGMLSESERQAEVARLGTLLDELQTIGPSEDDAVAMRHNLVAEANARDLSTAEMQAQQVPELEALEGKLQTIEAASAAVLDEIDFDALKQDHQVDTGLKGSEVVYRYLLDGTEVTWDEYLRRPGKPRPGMQTSLGIDLLAGKRIALYSTHQRLSDGSVLTTQKVIRLPAGAADRDAVLGLLQTGPSYRAALEAGLDVGQSGASAFRIMPRVSALPRSTPSVVRATAGTPRSALGKPLTFEQVLAGRGKPTASGPVHMHATDDVVFSVSGNTFTVSNRAGTLLGHGFVEMENGSVSRVWLRPVTGSASPGTGTTPAGGAAMVPYAGGVPKVPFVGQAPLALGGRGPLAGPEQLGPGNPTTMDLDRLLTLRGRARWEAGELYVQEIHGSAGQRHFPVPAGGAITAPGGRFVDAPVDLANGGVLANEVKTYLAWRTVEGVATAGQVPPSAKIMQQVLKDVYLRENIPGYDPRWLFLDAGPSPELADLLRLHRIVFVQYY